MELNDFLVPFLVFSVILTGIYRKTAVYDEFLTGAKNGALTAFSILPNILAIMVAINMLKASGAMDIMAKILSPMLNAVGMPKDVLPLALMRPLSGSASLSIVGDIFKTCGADSKAGLIASVMMGATETTFYTVALYFGSAGIKNIRHTLFAACAADITGIIASIIVTKLYFGI